MIRNGLLSALVVALLTGAAPVAAQFMAADLIYLPAVVHTDGEGASRWRSDIYITNVEGDVDIDIAMAYLPTGLVSNSGVYVDRSTWLGGRESDGFGFIDPQLADVPPGGTVFAYEADTLEDDGTRVFKNAIVNSRAFTPFTFFVPDPDNEDEFLQRNGTYGQTLPGVPWYNLADPSAVSENGDFSFELLTGGDESEDFRFNVGFLNASDPLTTITVVLQPFRPNGEPFPSAEGGEISAIVTMPPASHVQYNSIFTSLFGFGSVPEGTTLKISVMQWNSGSSEPVVGMTMYGNLIDNTTQDPTAILPVFGYPYNVECQWPSTGTKSAGGGSYPRVSRRPVEIPSR
jgi:hypothetical protein